MYLKQPLTPPQRKIIVAYRNWIIDLPLKLDNSRVSLFVEVLAYATFAHVMRLKNEAHFCVEVSPTP